MPKRGLTHRPKQMGEEPIRREQCQICAGDVSRCPCEGFSVDERVRICEGYECSRQSGQIKRIEINTSQFVPVGFWVQMEVADRFGHSFFMFQGDEIVHDGDPIPDRWVGYLKFRSDAPPKPDFDPVPSDFYLHFGESKTRGK